MGIFRAIRSPLVARSLASATASPALSVAVTAMATLARTAKAVDNFMMMNEGPGKDEGRIDAYFVISVAYKREVSVSSDSGLCIFHCSELPGCQEMRPPQFEFRSLVSLSNLTHL
jgi:hypothetical protein